MGTRSVAPIPVRNLRRYHRGREPAWL